MTKYAYIDRKRHLFNLMESRIDHWFSEIRYYPFGMVMPNRNWLAGGSDEYGFGFSGHEKILEVHDNTNYYDLGARFYDGRIARTLSIDPETDLYPHVSPFAYVLNNPVNAVDPDGRLVIFINGLRLWKGAADQEPIMGGGGIYNEQTAGALRDYWKIKSNAFGRNVDIAESFMQRIGDRNAYFTSGSSTWDSEANPGWFRKNVLGIRSRYDEGVSKANKFHKMVKKGKITLEDGETIKIVTHSQGGAHGEGMANRLIELGYTVEVIYNITPHQPTDMSNPGKVRGVQYSHPGDAISSDDPWWLTNGGSEFGKIKGITEFDGRDIMGGEGQPACEGPNGNRCGHNVTDNDFIFSIPQGKPGYVAPRKDKL